MGVVEGNAVVHRALGSVKVACDEVVGVESFLTEDLHERDFDCVSRDLCKSDVNDMLPKF